MVKYKMVRFFDFSAVPGKSYRYRVCVQLEDPNRPRDPKAEPNQRILDQTVVDRLAKVVAEDEKKTQETGKLVRTDFIQTDWSEPSNVVTIEKPEWFAAGGATLGRIIPLKREGPEVQISESSGKLAVAVWDASRATEVPIEKTVYPGSFLNFTESADVLNPLALQLRTVKDYSFETDAYVVDLRGGEKLLVDKAESKDEDDVVHTTPGEMLIVDGQGNLIVCNEVDDAEDYRRFLFMDDTQQAAQSAYGGGYGDEEGGYGGEEGYEMGEYGSGYPMGTMEGG
jgi:hypothetical protein